MGRIVIYNIREELTLRQKVSSFAKKLFTNFSDVWTRFVSDVFHRQYSVKTSLLGLACLSLVSSSCGVTTTSEYNALNTQAGYTAPSSAHIYALKRKITQSPDNIIQASAVEVREIFRKPHLERLEYPTFVWQYASGECVMDLYFTDLEKSKDISALPVQYVEMRNRAGEKLGQTEQVNCMRALINASKDREIGTIKRVAL